MASEQFWRIFSFSFHNLHRKDTHGADQKPISFGSSGDLAADRRYQWGLGAAEHGDHEAARDLFAQTLDLVPDWAPAWFALAQALEALGRRDEAVDAYREGSALDARGLPRRRPVPGAARRRRTRPPRRAPMYETLFDQYAATFDSHLVEGLAYRGPQILLSGAGAGGAGPAFSAHVLDLGCGAGFRRGHFATRRSS